MVLLSITPLPDGVLQLDIIAPFHTSGPPLLQFHLDIEQWGFIARNSNTTFTFPIMFTTLYAAMRTAYGVSGRDPSWDEIAIPSATVKQINLGSCYWASYVIAIGI